jgi:hypothetical protein
VVADHPVYPFPAPWHHTLGAGWRRQTSGLLLSLRAIETRGCRDKQTVGQAQWLQNYFHPLAAWPGDGDLSHSLFAAAFVFSPQVLGVVINPLGMLTPGRLNAAAHNTSLQPVGNTNNLDAPGPGEGKLRCSGKLVSAGVCGLRREAKEYQTRATVNELRF